MNVAPSEYLFMLTGVAENNGIRLLDPIFDCITDFG